jgi:hypothetical protein
MGSPTGRYFGQQITVKAAQTAWILRMCQHPRPVASHDKTNYVLPCGRRFWSQICGQRTCRPYNQLFERGNIYTHERLDRGLILWRLAPMGLQHMKIGYFDARIYQETIVEI